MKHSGILKTLSAVCAAAFLCASCGGFFDPPVEQAAGNTGIVVSVGNGFDGARTILPDTSGIDHYTLEITDDATQSVTSETITGGGTTKYVELGVGTYTIVAKAWSDAAEKQLAAEGRAENVQVAAGQSTPVSIALRAITTGSGNGTLNWSVAGDWDKLLSRIEVNMFAWDKDVEAFTSFHDFSIGNTEQKSGTETIPAGEYLLSVRFMSQDGKGTAFNDIVYIVEGLTTTAAYAVTEADFGLDTVITGTVSYRVNNVEQSDYSLTVRYGQNWLGDCWVPNNGEAYTLKIPRPDKNITVFFYIDGYLADSLDIASGAATASKNIDINRQVVELSGTLAVQNMGDENYGFLEFFELYTRGGYNQAGYVNMYSLSGSNTWSCSIDPSSADRKLIALFSASTENGYFSYYLPAVITVPANAASVGNLDYTVDLSVLSGSINGVVNLTGGTTIINAQVQAFDAYGTSLGSAVSIGADGFYTIPYTSNDSVNYSLKFTATVDGASKTRTTFPGFWHYGGADPSFENIGIVDMSVNDPPPPVIVSGTASITIDGSPLVNEWVSFYLEEETAPGVFEDVAWSNNYTDDQGNVSFSMRIEGGYSTPHALRLQIGFYGDILYTGTVSVGSASVTVQPITVTLTSQTSKGTVTRNGTPINNNDESWMMFLLDRQLVTLDDVDKVIAHGYGNIEADGSFSMVTYGISTGWFVVEKYNRTSTGQGGNITLYVARNASAIPFTGTLELNDMDILVYEEPDEPTPEKPDPVEPPKTSKNRLLKSL